MPKLTKKMVTMCGGMILAAAGCQESGSASNPYIGVRNTPPDQLSSEPLVVDGAMQLRDWDRSTAQYADGDTIAGPTGFFYKPRSGQPEWHYLIEETPLFLFQVVALPVTLIITPPCTAVEYAGATVEPTYTAMPPLPASYVTTDTNDSAATDMPAEMVPATQSGM